MTKTALIIGAQDYDPRDGLTPLSCARNDALALGRVLREQCGFGDVRVLAGEGIADSDGRPTKSAIRSEIRRLQESPERIELLVVAFCAHGLTLPVGGADRYYLLPEDAHQHEPDSFLEFADLMRRLNEIPANDRAVIFDTCRNRPEAGRASGDNLLARDLSIELLTRPEDRRKGTTAVLTACSLGERAYEMQDAGHGVFFHFLLQGMKGPAWTKQGTLSLNDAFGYAEREIADRPVFRQRPTFEQKGGGVILLGQREEPSASADAKAGQPRPNPAALADALDLAFWQSVQSSTVAAEFDAYLREFPVGRFVTLARQRLEVLRPSVPLGQPTNQAPMRESGYPVPVGESFRDCPEGPEMVVIPAGKFVMGSPEDEEGRSSNEGPQREVVVKAPLAVGKYAVTFDEWDAAVAAGGCGGYRPDDEGWGRGRRPVINVSWDDAQAYVRWLSQRTGRGYRLLTEAEWEYACRAGTTTPFSFGETISPAQANFDGNYTYGGGATGEYRRRTAPVGEFPANVWGLHEMHGNVFEWVEDVYRNSHAGAPTDAAMPVTGDAIELRVLRGGSWGVSPLDLRSAYRVGYAPDIRDVDLGFRLARTPGG